MKILKKLTIESIRKNRKRSVLTVLGILLSTALILAVAGMVSSARATLIRFAKENEGDYHLLFYDVPEEKLSYIDSHANVADSFRIQMLGYAAFPNSNSRTRPYYLLQGCSGEALSRIRLQLKSGRLPENESEVVVSEPAVYNGGMQVELGSTLHLALGERRDETGAVLTEYTVYEEDHPETLENTIEKEYTIVGVAAESNTLSGFYASSYHLYTCLTPEEMAQGDGLYAVGVTLADVQKLSATIADLQENIYEDRAPDYMYYYGMNGELLRYEGAVGTDLIQVLRRIAAVVVVIILLTSVFVIRNSFRMSVSEKTRQYGMLISVGATGKQIRKSEHSSGDCGGVCADGRAECTASGSGRKRNGDFSVFGTASGDSDGGSRRCGDHFSFLLFSGTAGGKNRAGGSHPGQPGDTAFFEIPSENAAGAKNLRNRRRDRSPESAKKPEKIPDDGGFPGAEHLGVCGIVLPGGPGPQGCFHDLHGLCLEPFGRRRL